MLRRNCFQSIFGLCFVLIAGTCLAQPSSDTAAGAQPARLVWQSESSPFGHRDPVRSAAFSPDGRTLATCTSNRRNDKTFHLWDLATGKLLRQFERLLPATGGTTAVAFSPDGKLLVGCWGLGNVTVWDVASGDIKFSKKLHGETCYQLKFVPDGSHFVTGGMDGKICVTRVADQTVVATWGIEPEAAPVQVPLGIGVAFTEAILSMDLSPDGNRIAIARHKSVSSEAIVFEIGAKEPVVRIEEPNTGEMLNGRAFHSVRFSSDGSQLIAGGARVVPKSITQIQHGPLNIQLLEIKRWNAKTGEPAGEMALPEMPGFGEIEVSTDGKFLAAEADGIHIWRMGEEKPFVRIPSKSGWMRFSPDSKRLVTSIANGVQVWDVATGELLVGKDAVAPPVAAVAWRPDGRQFALGAGDNLEVWDAAAHTPVAKISFSDTAGLSRRDGGVKGVAFSADGTTLIAAGNRSDPERDSVGIVRQWDAESRQLEHEIVLQTELDSTLSRFFVAADGRRAVAVGEQGRSLAVLDLVERKQLAQLTDVRGFRQIHAARLTPDGQFVWVADRTGQIFRWDFAQNARLDPFLAEWRTKEEGAGGSEVPWIDGAAFSPDARTLVTAHARASRANPSGALVFWDVELKQTKRIHRDERSYALTVSPDGRLLAGIESASPTGRDPGDTIHIWNLATGEKLFTLQPQNAYATAVAFSPDSKQLLTGFDRGTFAVWDVQ